jgi:plasmid stabilization system protein ParE
VLPVEFSLRAERQLAAVEAWYLKEAGAQVADNAAAAILDAAERLGTLPVIYRAAARAGLREYVMGNSVHPAVPRAATENSSCSHHSPTERSVRHTVKKSRGHGMNISAKSVRFDNYQMWVDLSDGRTVGMVPAPVARHARTTGRLRHWPLRAALGAIDEDISLAGLLAGRGDMTHRLAKAA